MSEKPGSIERWAKHRRYRGVRGGAVYWVDAYRAQAPGVRESSLTQGLEGVKKSKQLTP